MDTGKIGGNKYVNYSLEDFMKDRDLSRQGAIRDLEARDIFLTDLKPIAPKPLSESFLIRLLICVKKSLVRGTTSC